VREPLKARQYNIIIWGGKKFENKRLRPSFNLWYYVTKFILIFFGGRTSLPRAIYLGGHKNMAATLPDHQRTRHLFFNYFLWWRIKWLTNFHFIFWFCYCRFCTSHFYGFRKLIEFRKWPSKILIGDLWSILW